MSGAGDTEPGWGSILRNTGERAAAVGLLSQCGGAGAAEHRLHGGERVFGLPGGVPGVQQRNHAALPAQLPL